MKSIFLRLPLQLHLVCGIKVSLTLHQATSSTYVSPQQVVNELDKRWSWQLGELCFLLQFSATGVSELQYVYRI